MRPLLGEPAEDGKVKPTYKNKQDYSLPPPRLQRGLE